MAGKEPVSHDGLALCKHSLEFTYRYMTSPNRTCLTKSAARTAILNVFYGQTATEDRHLRTQKGCSLCLSPFDYNSKVVCHIHENNHQIDFTDRIERIKNYI